MPFSLLTSTVPGALVSLAAHLRNAARKAGDTEPQAAAAPSQPQGSGPGTSPGIRFDFSAPAAAVPAAGTSMAVLPSAPAAASAAFVPAIPETAPAAPLAAPALSAVRAPVAGPVAAPAAGTTAPAPAVPPQPAERSAAQAAGPGVGVSAPQAAGTAPAGPGARRPESAGLDDEERARAWAIRTVARENTLNMIGRIALLAERPEPAEAAQDSAAKASSAAEPRTLARV